MAGWGVLVYVAGCGLLVCVVFVVRLVVLVGGM